MSALDDALHKLKRGKEHLADFYARIDVAFNENHITHNVEAYPQIKPFFINDPRPWTQYTVYYSSVPVITFEDCILMGEAIQDFRSALDYFAWAWFIKIKSSLTKWEEWQISFPMSRNQKSFTDNRNDKLPNFPDWTFIERYQPYQPTDKGRWMGYLRVLSDTDKHRIIIPAPMLPADGIVEIKGFELWGRLIRVIDRLKLGQEIKKGTQIISAIIAGVPPAQDQVHVDATTTIMPVFPIELIPPTSPDDIVDVEFNLNGIRDVCEEILTEAAKYF